MEFNIIKHIQSLRKNRETDKRISEVIISSDITLVDNQGQKLNEAYDDHGTLTIANNIKKEKGVIIFYESDDSFVAVRVEKVIGSLET